ncbi:MAG: type II toxin-antitoxin system RelE/ParE family toxin [Thiomicrospira sp.]|uniref:type II toxin-antitoxin system RelE/ParE family toxin n=1 Tax=Thiomicrospira sp. TaxID=935 RepID=UPI0019F76A47|nr:type II toxin-antitoxin system RelE/ParE family toxin [Thiomicrospira sp.]
MRYEISEQAALDIQEIFVYTILNFGSPQANAYLKGLRDTFKQLTDFPEIGQDISMYCRCIVDWCIKVTQFITR